MPEPVLLEGPAALDVIVRSLAPKLSETWPGDEALVGMIVKEGERIGIVWAPRERVLADLAQRRDVERDPRRRERYESAIGKLSGARIPGKVSLLVAGWGDMMSIEIEADDLRTGKLLTTWRAGSA